VANKITTVLDLDDRGFSKSVGNIRKEIAQAEGATGKFKAAWGSAMTSLKANAGIAAAGVGLAMFKVGKDAVNAASELEQSTGGVEKAFGETADAVLQIGINADETMGLSKRAFNDGALALSAFAEDIARDTGKPVAEVIQDLMQRASDFAAAYGTSVPDAVRIFSSTLAGESEPIKRYGILINETETKAYAAEKGIQDMGKASQRAALLMDETAKFAGQFADESDTLAGAQARLKAKIENLQAELGEELLPAVANVTGGLTDLLSVWTTLTTSAPVKLLIEISGNDSALGLMNEIGQFAAGVPGTKKAFGMVKGAIDDAGDATLITTGRIGDLTGVTDEAKKATEDAAGALEWERQALSYAGRAADETKRKTEALERSFKELRDELSDQSAYLDVQESFDNLLEKGVEAFDGTEESAREFQRAVIDTKNDVLDVIENLGDVPQETTAEILALIDQGKFDAAEARLADLTRLREAKINITSTYTPSRYTLPGGGSVVMHDGGIVGGRSFAGLKADEVPAVLQKGEAVLTREQQAAVASGTSGTPTVVNVTVNGADPNMVIAAIRKYVRTNGPVTGIT